MNNWVKVVLAASLMTGIGHCCRHYNIMNINNLRFGASNPKMSTTQSTPSVEEGISIQNTLAPFDSTPVRLDSLAQKDSCYVINWDMLAKTKFDPVKIDSLDGLIVLFPKFPKLMQALAGKNVMLKGFVIPVEETGDDQVLVLSANPYTTCFFCGQAGPESIVDIRLKNPKSVRRFKKDEKVSFKGQLNLNDKDFDYFNYIIENAEWVKE